MKQEDTHDTCSKRHGRKPTECRAHPELLPERQIFAPFIGSWDLLVTWYGKDGRVTRQERGSPGAGTNPGAALRGRLVCVLRVGDGVRRAHWPMIYELRIHRYVPGRKSPLQSRFENETLRISKKHGIREAGLRGSYCPQSRC
jgi:hypothetical protein